MILTQTTVGTFAQEDSPVSPGVTLRTSLCQKWDSVEELRPAWDSILETNALYTIFSTPEWLGSWWKAYGAGKELASLILKDETDAVAAIIPMYREPIGFRLGRRLQYLRLVGDGTGDSDNLDLPVRLHSKQASITALVNWAEQDTNWDVCRLDTLDENSGTLAFLIDDLTRRRWPLTISRTPKWHIPLPRTWDQYIQGLSPEFRPLLTRYPRRLESRYPCQVVRCTTTTDLQKYLPVLFELHQKRWEDIGEPGSFAMEDRRHFYQYIAAAFLQRGWLEFWIMELNGTAVAAQFCFQYNNSVYLLQEGFDPQYAKDKVGYALRSRMLQHFIQQGLERYDVLGGTQAHKQKFGAVQGSYVNIEFAKPRTLGAAYLRLDRRTKQTRNWLKANLPDSMLALIRRQRSRRR